MWHGLKNVAMRFTVNVAFSTPVKIASICPGVQNRYEKMALDGHGGVVSLMVSVLFHASRTWFTEYLCHVAPRTSVNNRWVNTSLREYRASLEHSGHACMAAHCRRASAVLFFLTRIIFRHEDCTIRSFQSLPHKLEEKWVYQPAFSQLVRKIRFLDGTQSWPVMLFTTYVVSRGSLSTVCVFLIKTTVHSQCLCVLSLPLGSSVCAL